MWSLWSALSIYLLNLFYNLCCLNVNLTEPKKRNCLNKIVWMYILLYYVLKYSLQWWCGIYLGPVWSKALCLGWHTGIVSWCLSMPAFHATTCWALGTSRHTHTWMIRENLNWFIFKFLKIPICNTSIEKDYVILLIVVYEE